MGLARRLRSWWLHSRDERCASCGHHYAHGTQRHCAACDRAVCAFCAAEHQREHFCPECLPRPKTKRKRRT